MLLINDVEVKYTRGKLREIESALVRADLHYLILTEQQHSHLYHLASELGRFLITSALGQDLRAIRLSSMRRMTDARRLV